MTKSILLSTAMAIMVLATNALANWEHQSSDEDIFGNTNVTATSFGDNGNILLIECGSSIDGVRAAFLMKSGGEDLPYEFPSRFIIKSADGTRLSADATLTDWNENFWAVVTTDQKIIRALADHMKVAVRSIPVGIEILSSGGQISDTFSARGSTAASKTIITGCFGLAPGNSERSSGLSFAKDKYRLSDSTIISDTMDRLISEEASATHYEINGKGIMLYEDAPADFVDSLINITGRKHIEAMTFTLIYCEKYGLNRVFDAGYTLNIYVRQNGFDYIRLGGRRVCPTLSEISAVVKRYANN